MNVVVYHNPHKALPTDKLSREWKLPLHEIYLAHPVEFYKK